MCGCVCVRVCVCVLVVHAVGMSAARRVLGTARVDRGGNGVATKRDEKNNKAIFQHVHVTQSRSLHSMECKFLL